MLKGCDKVQNDFYYVAYVENNFPFTDTWQYSWREVKASKIKSHCKWLKEKVECETKVDECIPVPFK
jgi:translation elongation factor P/translation initiation factor 5A